MSDSHLEIRLLETSDEMSTAVVVFQQVWGSVTPIVGSELLRAIAHSGGYVAGAFDAGNMIGASFGFLGRHGDDGALHSHVTGILPGVQHSGVGRAMKNHQRGWAAAHDIPWITWTFDPLVRRNAWFNIGVLGCDVAEYLPNFYGTMHDSINGADDSDRLVVAWATADAETDTGRTGDRPGAANTIEIPTPDDIIVLRRTDPAAALDWRMRVRAELGDRMTAGATVIGFTRDGCYVLVPA